MSWMKKSIELTAFAAPLRVWCWRRSKPTQQSKGRKSSAAKRKGVKWPANWINEVGGLWAAAPLPRMNAAPTNKVCFLFVILAFLFMNKEKTSGGGSKVSESINSTWISFICGKWMKQMKGMDWIELMNGAEGSRRRPAEWPSEAKTNEFNEFIWICGASNQSIQTKLKD